MPGQAPTADTGHLAAAGASQGQAPEQRRDHQPQVILNFDGESKSLKKPVFDEVSKTLTLPYPQAQYQVVIDLLRSETVYVQFLSYANSHVWADLHTGAVRSR